MRSTTRTKPAERFAKRITRQLRPGQGERYTFDDAACARIEAMLDAAAEGPNPTVEVGVALKLVHVLRTRHASPGAAQRLLDTIERCPGAMRVVALEWSGGRRRRLGPDGKPVERTLAHHIAAPPVAGAVHAKAFLTPGRDLRTAHLAKRGRTR